MTTYIVPFFNLCNRNSDWIVDNQNFVSPKKNGFIDTLDFTITTKQNKFVVVKISFRVFAVGLLFVKSEGLIKLINDSI